MNNGTLAPAERWMRTWMLLSAWTYGLAVPFFLFFGGWIVPVVNWIAVRILPLPSYEPASGVEGAFWRVLSVSMMVMLTWASVQVYRDVRGRLFVVQVILFSKACSTLCYLGFFLTHGAFAYLVGVITDGPIFMVTLALWFLALPKDHPLDEVDLRILRAAGEALMPQGGKLSAAYADHADTCLARASEMVGAQSTLGQAMTRLAFRLFNLAPIPLTRRMITFLGMTFEDRVAFVQLIENNRFHAVRLLVMAVKTYVMLPLCDIPEVASAMGYELDEGREAPAQ